MGVCMRALDTSGEGGGGMARTNNKGSLHAIGGKLQLHAESMLAQQLLRCSANPSCFSPTLCRRDNWEQTEGRSSELSQSPTCP